MLVEIVKSLNGVLLNEVLNVLVNLLKLVQANFVLQVLIVILIAEILMIITKSLKLIKKWFSLSKIKSKIRNLIRRGVKLVHEVRNENDIKPVNKGLKSYKVHEKSREEVVSESLEHVKRDMLNKKFSTKELPQHILSNVRKIKIQAKGSEELSSETFGEFSKEKQEMKYALVKERNIGDLKAPTQVNIKQLVNLLKELNSNVKELSKKLVRYAET